MNNSQLPGDHVVAGSFETAARVRYKCSTDFHSMSEEDMQ